MFRYDLAVISNRLIKFKILFSLHSVLCNFVFSLHAGLELHTVCLILH